MTALSPREQQVLELLAAGYQDRGIAAEMSICRDTVTKKKRSLYGKLGASTAAHAVHLGHQVGLLGGAPADAGGAR